MEKNKRTRKQVQVIKFQFSEEKKQLIKLSNDKSTNLLGEKLQVPCCLVCEKDHQSDPYSSVYQ